VRTVLLCSSGLRAAIASSTNSGPFQQGLTIVFAAAATMAVIAAGASALRGGRYVHEETQAPSVELTPTPAELGQRLADR
jgi:hypothetical protein